MRIKVMIVDDHEVVRLGLRAALEMEDDMEVVANWARWFIIASVAVFVLWSASTTDKLIVGIIPVVALMAINFYLHGRYMAERPANRALIVLTSLMDIALITAVVLFWPGAGGLRSPFFIMYYPVVLAFAFIMPPRITLVFTVAALGAYAGASFLAEAFGDAENLLLLSSNGDIIQSAFESLVTRLITIGAMGVLGTYYWRIQRNRRRAATEKSVDAQEQPATS
jgi:hypothetical protein